MCAELDYGEQPRRHWWRVVRRPARIILLAGLGALVGWWVLTQGVYLYWQSRCLHYVAPADLVVYDDDPTEAQRTVGAALATHTHGLLVNTGGAASPGHRPVGRIIPEFKRTLLSYEGTMFLGWRTTPSGERKFAAVWPFTFEGQPGGYELRLVHGSLKLASAIPGSQMVMADADVSLLFVPAGKRLRVFAGQADPADPTHFTIQYELGGEPGVLDGFLRNDGLVDLRVRSGPATLSPAKS